MIYIIGLGKNDNDISRRGYQLMLSCRDIFVKTMKVASSNFLNVDKITYKSFDYLFDESYDFDELNDEISKVIRNCSGDVCYLVPFSTRLDTSVIAITEGLKMGVDYQNIGATSQIDEVIGNVNSVNISAYNLPDIETFCYDKSFDLCFYDIDNLFVLSNLKCFLGEVVGDEVEVEIYLDNHKKTLKVYELDRGEIPKSINHNTVVKVGTTSLRDRTSFTYYDLLELVNFLRSPNGCPWDKEQTHSSLKDNLMSEAQELYEAIEKSDYDNMMEECGDVLLQTVFHSSIASQNQEFTSRDVINGICEKLIRRHSHIFGDDKATTVEQVKEIWQKNKKLEKDNKK